MPITKKKKWYKIIAPVMFDEQEIGETYIAEPEKTIGRSASVNLMVLTNDPKRQNINVEFRISGIEGEKLKTEIYSYSMVPSSLKRFVRRGRDRIDDSFICTTSDKKSIKIKPLLITRFQTKNSVASALRLSTRKFLKDMALNTKFNDLMKDILSHRAQNQLRGHLKKICELRTCEIRSIEKKAEGQKAEEVEIKEEEKEKGEVEEIKKESKEDKLEGKETKEEEKKVKEEKKEEKTETKEKTEEKKEKESKKEEKERIGIKEDNKKESKEESEKEGKNNK